MTWNEIYMGDRPTAAVLTVTDPWDLCSAGCERIVIRVLEGAVREDTGQSYLLCEPVEPVRWSGPTADFLVLVARHEGVGIWPLPSPIDPGLCNFTGLGAASRRAEPPWGAERWRGGGVAGTGAVSRLHDEEAS